jgi:ATP-binding cassette subfamily F protein 3
VISITGLSKYYGTQTLFEDLNLIVGQQERIGLVGRNGHGKSTLFRIILGEEQPDSGTIVTPDHYKIGCLSQHLHFECATVLEEVEQVLPEQEGGWKETHKAEEILQGLGFDKNLMQAKPETLSGGYQIRINLARLLVSEADLLLLDEPTNYLDIVSIRWLISFLRNWKQELVLITHDRHFMDAVVTHIAGIHRYQLKKIKGTTEKFYAQVEQEELIHEQSRLNQEKKRAETEDFIRRFRAKATKASAVQSRVKALAREEQLEKLDEIASLEFAFRFADFRAKHLLEVQDLAFGYTEENLVSDLSFSIGKDDRIAVIGQNGKGKSTLLRLLAGELSPRDGAISSPAHLKSAYFGQTNVDRLNAKWTVEQEVLSCFEEPNRTVARGICGLMMFSGDAALKEISVLSGGERSRVMLGKVLATSSNLLLLDEPTNHLDMESAAALKNAIKNFPGAVVIVTHDEGLIEDLANRLIVFDRNKSELFEGTYQDFLERVGWESEPEVEKSDTSKSPVEKLDKKTLRKLRADLNNRRSETLKPLKRKISALEKQIVDLEKKLEVDNAELIEASKDGFGDNVAKLSREVHGMKEMIDELFEELDTVTQEHDSNEKAFTAEMNELKSRS